MSTTTHHPRQHRPHILAWCTVVVVVVSAGAFTAARAAARPEHLATSAAGTAASTASTAAPGGTPTGTASDPTLVGQGHKLFLTSCSSCHGVDGRGVTLPSGRVQGPSLVGVGTAAAYFVLSTGRMPLADPRRQPEEKPPAFTPKQQQSLVAYVASLGNGPALPKLNLPAANLATGGELYRENCAPCHNASGVGGALSYGRHAPSLLGASPLVVGAAVRFGPGQMPRFGANTLTDAQVSAIAKYVKYLHHPDDRGGLSLGRLGPVPEGFAIWVLGLGLLLVGALWISRQVRSYR